MQKKRGKIEEISHKLTERGCMALAYHSEVDSDVDSEYKRQVQKKKLWMEIYYILWKQRKQQHLG